VNGHRWYDIQKYSLGEIGVFLRSIDSIEANKLSSTLALNWLSFHASKDYINKQLTEMTTREISRREAPVNEKKDFESEWNRLAANLAGGFNRH